MKSKSLRIILTSVSALLIIGVVGYYFYDVFCLNTPYTRNLFKMLTVVAGSFGAIAKLNSAGRGKSLAFYENAYKEQIGNAFEGKPSHRKKLLRACRAYDEGKYNKAIRMLFKLLKSADGRKDEVPVLLFIALCYTDSGVPNEAIGVYNDLLKVDPFNATAYSNLGLLYLHQGDYETAISNFDKSIHSDYSNYYAYSNIANCYFRMDNYDKAIYNAELALKHKNNGVEAAGLLTIIYALIGDEANKKRCYHLAITAGQSPKKLNAAIEYYLSEKQIPSYDDEDEEE